eukprot:scaffold633_cov134-Isochrysis_galbana.AAC.4
MDGGLGPGWVLTRYWICVCVWRAKQAATLHTVYWDAWTPGPRTTGYDWLALVQHWQLEAGALKKKALHTSGPRGKLVNPTKNRNSTKRLSIVRSKGSRGKRGHRKAPHCTQLWNHPPAQCGLNKEKGQGKKGKGEGVCSDGKGHCLLANLKASKQHAAKQRAGTIETLQSQYTDVSPVWCAGLCAVHGGRYRPRGRRRGGNITASHPRCPTHVHVARARARGRAAT